MVKHKDSQKQPPKYALRFFRWFCRPEMVEDIEGDLRERYGQHLYESGRQKASRKFGLEVLKLFRPGIVRPLMTCKIENYQAMFRHNFIISWRSLKRDKMTSLINISSLTIGMASALLILLWVQDELQFDQFHEHKDRLYHVMNNIPTANGIITRKSSAAPLSQALNDEIPEVDQAVVAAGGHRGRGIATSGDKAFKALEYYVGPNFFEVFSFEVLYGNPGQILSEKSSVMISETLARNIFADPDQAIGQTISWDRNELSGDYLVGGIFADVPSHSSLQFDMLFSYQQYYDTYEQINNLWNWGNSNPMTFVRLQEGADLSAFNAKIKDFSKDKYKAQNGKEASWIGDLFTQPFAEAYLYNGYRDGVQQGGRITYVKLFTIIGFFILLIACINFMNMTTAKAGRRIKEIGVKKSIGASRRNLQYQYLVESTFVAFIALLFSVLLVAILLPAFNVITEKDLTIWPGWKSVLLFLTIALVTGLVSGSYPAVFLSRLKPIHVLTGFWRSGSRDAWIRKSLVVFQFSLSAILLIGVAVLYNQMQLIQTKNLGYNRENIIRFDREGELERNLDLFLNEAEQIEGVSVATTLNNDITDNYSSTGSVRWEGWEDHERIQFYNFQGGYGMFDVFDLEFSLGRPYSEEYAKDEEAIIFNESAIAAMGLQDPIGEVINLWGQDRQIIGVVKDFHFQSLYEPLQPCFFLLSPDSFKILLKIGGENVGSTLGEIEALYHKFNEDVAFDFTFIDQDYQQLYAAETKTAFLSRYFAILAIIISCLGLYGMSVFSAERKLREISVRKILGASTRSIIQLLSREFLVVIMVALLLSLPVSYWLARNWLNSFAYHIDLHWGYFILTTLVCLTIAGVTISYQTLRATTVNPVEYLKDE